MTSAPGTEQAEQAEPEESSDGWVVLEPVRQRRLHAVPGLLGRGLRRVLPGWARPGARMVRRVGRRLAPPGWALTAASFVLVVGVLLAPDQYGQLGWQTLARVPLEALVLGALTLLLPERAARPVALVAGALVGLLGLLKVLDLGFSTTLGRPFDPVNDWSYFRNAKDYLTDLLGGPAGNAVFVLLAVLLVALVVLMAKAAGRLVRSMRRRRRVSGAVVGVLWLVWAVLAGTGVGAGADGSAPIGAAGILADHAARVPEGLSDRDSFEQDLANDDFADAGLGPGAGDLLSGLRGKDVLLVWVESYGRSALEKPAIARGIQPVLQRGQAQLAAKGFTARSGWLTSPVAGGGSWFAHSTLESGAWITNADRYSKLLDSDRTTLNKLFRRAGWRSVAMMPNVVRDWPEGAWYEFNRIYPFESLGYRGPNFGWSKVPDQYTLEKLYRLELAKKGRSPVMASVELGSSHSPWAPLPQLVDWKELAGDGSFYAPQRRQGPQRDDVWKNSDTLGQGYMRSLQYSLQVTFDFVARYGTKDTVVVYLGDHQPIPLVTGAKAGRDVPVTILSGDPAVLARIDDWGWQPGLTPDRKAPVWSMNLFRDRFLRAFGPA